MARRRKPTGSPLRWVAVYPDTVLVPEHRRAEAEEIVAQVEGR